MSSEDRHHSVTRRLTKTALIVAPLLSACLSCSGPTVVDATQATARSATAPEQPAIAREGEAAIDLPAGDGVAKNAASEQAAHDWLSMLTGPGGGILQLPVREGLDLVPTDAVAWVVVRDARVVVFAAKRLLGALLSETMEVAPQTGSTTGVGTEVAGGADMAGPSTWVESLMLLARDRGSAASLLALVDQVKLKPGRGVVLSVARDSWSVLVPLEDLGALAPFAVLAGMTSTALSERCAVASDALGYIVCSPTPGVAAKYRPGRTGAERVESLGGNVTKSTAEAAVIAGVGAGPAAVTGPISMALELGDRSMTLVTDFTPPAWLTSALGGDRIGRELTRIVQPGDAVLLATRVSPALLSQFGAPLSSIATTLSGEVLVGTVAGHQALAIGVLDAASLRTTLTFASFAAGSTPFEITWPTRLSVGMSYDSIYTDTGRVERLHLELGGLESAFAMLGDGVSPTVDLLIFDGFALALLGVPQARLITVANRIMTPEENQASGLDEVLGKSIDEGRVVAFSQLDLGVLGSASARQRALETVTAGMDESQRKRIAAMLELASQLCGGMGQTALSLEIGASSWTIRSRVAWRSEALPDTNVREELKQAQQELSAAAQVQLVWLTSALRFISELVPS